MKLKAKLQNYKNNVTRLSHLKNSFKKIWREQIEGS